MTEFADKPVGERMQYFIDKSDLIGKRIVDVTYTSDEEKDARGWYNKGPELVLNDGTIVTFLMDDEGNGPGSAEVFTVHGDTWLPVF